jgi:hypothetical protein
MMRKFGFAVLALVGAAAPALAADQNGYQAIVSGDLAAAERHILAEQAVYPGRPELMLNLAAVYRRTGREADARALYKRVLERRDIAMDLPSGAVASSHDLARRALGVAPVQIATR